MCIFVFCKLTKLEVGRQKLDITFENKAPLKPKLGKDDEMKKVQIWGNVFERNSVIALKV